jgi:hypothetical protein
MPMPEVRELFVADDDVIVSKRIDKTIVRPALSEGVSCL